MSNDTARIVARSESSDGDLAVTVVVMYANRTAEVTLHPSDIGSTPQHDALAKEFRALGQSLLSIAEDSLKRITDGTPT